MQSVKFKMRNTESENSKIYNLRSAICDENIGFTLLELIVVIFIVSLVFALSLPSFTEIGESRIKSDAKKLASVMRYLNDSAITTKESLFLKTGLKEKVIHYNGPDGERSERFDTISGLELQTKGMVSEGEVTIFFGPSGALESFRFHLREGTKSTVVALNALSGRVRITDETQNAK